MERRDTDVFILLRRYVNRSPRFSYKSYRVLTTFLKNEVCCNARVFTEGYMDGNGLNLSHINFCVQGSQGIDLSPGMERHGMQRKTSPHFQVVLNEF